MTVKNVVITLTWRTRPYVRPRIPAQTSISQKTEMAQI